MSICSVDGCNRTQPCGPYCRDNGNLNSEPGMPYVSTDKEMLVTDIKIIIGDDSYAVKFDKGITHSEAMVEARRILDTFDRNIKVKVDAGIFDSKPDSTDKD